MSPGAITRFNGCSFSAHLDPHEIYFESGKVERTAVFSLSLTIAQDQEAGDPSVARRAAPLTGTSADEPGRYRQVVELVPTGTSDIGASRVFASLLRAVSSGQKEVRADTGRPQIGHGNQAPKRRRRRHLNSSIDCR